MTEEQPGGTWSYRAGAWFGVFGPRTTLLLPASEKARVVDLWALVDEGAAFGEVLDGLVASGLSSLPGFVLVGSDGPATTVLLRGPGVRAVLEGPDGTVEVDGADATTWSERRVADVSTLMVTTGEEDQTSADAGDGGAADDSGTVADDGVEGSVGAARDFAIDRGLVRVARVDRPERTAAPVAGAAVASPPSDAPTAPPSVDAEPSPLEEESDTAAQVSPYAVLGLPAPGSEDESPAASPAESPAERRRAPSRPPRRPTSRPPSPPRSPWSTWRRWPSTPSPTHRRTPRRRRLPARPPARPRRRRPCRRLLLRRSCPGCRCRRWVRTRRATPTTTG